MGNITVTALSEHVGADVIGVDLRKPLSDAEFAIILDAFHRYSVVRLRETGAHDADVVALSARFGRNKIHDLFDYLDGAHPELMRVSNIEENGNPIGLKDSAVLWHSDMAYRADPNPISVLVAEEITSWGGGTRFASMRAAYDALPNDIKVRLDELWAVHSIRNYAYKPGEGMPSNMQDEYPEVLHPVVVTHPVTGRKALYVSEGTTVRIDGMDKTESRETLDNLLKHAVQQRFVWTQDWQVGDIIIWDNRVVVHQQTPYDSGERRLLKRTTVMTAHQGI